MRIHTALFSTETNTFSSLPTGLSSFGIFRGDATAREPEAFDQTPLGEWRRLADADGHEVVEGLAAGAAPAGTIPQPVYERLRDELIELLAEGGRFDVILLDLHGAMVAQNTWDCTTDILRHVRRVAGADVVIGVELDLHCQLAAETLELADVVICYKEYPHTDIVARAREVYRIAMATAAGRAKPVAALFDCKMVGGWPTIRPPMSDFVQRMQLAEGRDGVLSVSLAHGFPWGDVPACGAKLWVTTDGDQALAESLARQLGRAFYELRRETRMPQDDLEEALDGAVGSGGGLWVLADVADNPGGGAPGDSTFLLRRLLERGVRKAALGCLADPSVVLICQNAGVGATLDLRLGGKLGRTSGDPLDVRATVRALSDDLVQGSLGSQTSFGAAAWVEIEGIDVVVCAGRCQVFSTDAFTNIGVDLAGKRVVVVKSSQHFYTSFSRIAAEVRYISTPGALDLDFARIPYQHRDPNYWPRITDPLGYERGAT